MNESKIRELMELYSVDSKVPVHYITYGDKIEQLRKEIVKSQKSKNARKNIRKKVDAICDSYEEMNGIDVEKYFILGFSLATQILSEAFTN